MTYDIVWVESPKLADASQFLKRHPVELLAQNRWRWGWTLLDNTPMPDASGKIVGNGICISLRQPGLSCLNLGGSTPDKHLAALPYLSLEQAAPGIIGGNVDGSFWQRDDAKAQAETDAADLDKAAKAWEQTSSERQQRNEERAKKKLVLFLNYQKAVAALMGVPKPHKISPDVLETLYLMSKGRDDIPEPHEYLKHFADEILPEPEPEFIPSADAVEFYGFCKQAAGAIVSNQKVVKAL